jgi:hypothetical protein
VDGTGSGSCPVAGSGISGVEPSGSATRELVIFTPLLELCRIYVAALVQRKILLTYYFTCIVITNQLIL